jgi:hypothetical protein
VGPWPEHLAREGSVVIHPTYQSVIMLPGRLWPGAVRGIQAAVARVAGDRFPTMAAGDAAGAMAADGAAIPVPEGPSTAEVFAAYPGARLRGVPFDVPLVDPRRIPPGVLIEAVAGVEDRTVGEDVARALVRDAVLLSPARRRFALTREDPDDEQGAAHRLDPAVRAASWLRLDRLLAAARRR